MTDRSAAAAFAAAVLFAVTGCTSDPPDPIIPSGTPTPPMESPSMPSVGTPGPQDPAARTYPDTLAILTAINAEIPCEQNGRPDTTVYSDRSVSCFYKAPDGAEEQMTASTYLDEQQQDDALAYFLGDGSPQPGLGIVAGDLWTVVVKPDVGPRVAKAIGGTWMPPMPGGA